MNDSADVSQKSLKMGNIKGIIFDYGGTIDSRGVHWSEIIWNGYQIAQINVTKEQFRECYVFAERDLARNPHIQPQHNFYDLLLIKMRIELGYLAEQNLINTSIIDEKALIVAKYCYESARQCVEEARPTIEALYAKFPLVLVSNFYGNVESVLADFNLRHYFKTIVESAVVGVRKPDPHIFALGVEALGLTPKEVLVIGDSYKKDIVPAETIGCNVAWIKGKGWTADEDAITHPCIISNLTEIASF